MSAKNEKARREAEALKAKQAAEAAEVENQNNEAETSEKSVFVNGNDPQFDNLDWLKETSPAPFHVQANVSSKYDVKREPEILFGLEKISEIMPDQLPVELIMLAKWWEVTPAPCRKSVPNPAHPSRPAPRTGSADPSAGWRCPPARRASQRPRTRRTPRTRT